MAKNPARAQAARELLDALRDYRDSAGVINAQLVRSGDGRLNDSTLGRYLPSHRDRPPPATWPDWDSLVEPVVSAVLRVQGISESSPAHRQEIDRWLDRYEALGGVRPEGTAAGATGSGPVMTPPLPPHRVRGRERQLRELRNLLCVEERAAVNVPPVALRGLGGVGKTTLAAMLGHDPAVRRSLPGGVLWVSLGPRPQVSGQLERWGRRLGIDLLAEDDNAGRSELLRAELYDRRCLVVIDDVWEPRDARYFQVGGPHSRTLLTTREIIDITPAGRLYPVGVLDAESALDLLRELAPDAVEPDSTAAEELCRRMEYLPLGIFLGGRYLALETLVPGRMHRLLQGLINEGERRLTLPQDEGRLGLGDGPVSLGTILGMSVERLSVQDRRRFADLGVFGGEPRTWTIPMVAEFWNCSQTDAEDTVSILARRGLVEWRSGDRYWMHALLADYAVELAKRMP